jgi:predicted aspartyl protease
VAAEVPFRLAGGDNPLLLVPCDVNRAGPFEFILDSGATTCLVSRDLAERLGVEATDSREGTGAGGKIALGIGALKTLSVGAASQSDVRVGITDELERIGAFVGAKIFGVVGFNFFRHYRVTVDYRALLVRLSSPGDEGLAQGDSVAFQIAPTRPLLLLPVSVNGRGPYRFALDTGSSMSSISPDLARELGMTTTDAEEGGLGAGGAIEVAFTRADSIALGGSIVNGVDLTVPPFFPMLSQAAGAQLDGALGHNFLRNFRVTLDYPESAVRLERI